VTRSLYVVKPESVVEKKLRLMKAAPKLLEALKDLTKYAAPFICIVDDPPELIRALAAIAEAEGGL
jgi:hypothetical protein